MKNKKKKVEFTLHAGDKLTRLTKVGVTKEIVLKIMVVTVYPGERRRYE